MANYILLVFEGQKTEVLAWESIRNFFLNDLNDNTIIYGIYGNEIYSLYSKIKRDSDLDLFYLLKQSPLNKDLLSNIARDEVSEIFLFFDYDGHVGGATDEQLASMLKLFNEETEAGKLYISYPMIEALKHISSKVLLSETKVQCKIKINYKDLVFQQGDATYRNFRTINKTQWKYIVNEHCKKLNHLMTDSFTFPTRYFDQGSIFDQQLKKHIIPNNDVSVLSSFPVFILDYYGGKRLEEIILSAQ